jgi:hypothetical protein
VRRASHAGSWYTNNGNRSSSPHPNSIFQSGLVASGRRFVVGERKKKVDFFCARDLVCELQDYEFIGVG